MDKETATQGTYEKFSKARVAKRVVKYGVLSTTQVMIHVTTPPLYRNPNTQSRLLL